MARYVDVRTNPGRTAAGDLPGMALRIQLDNPLASMGGSGPKMFGQKAWRLMRPIPKDASKLFGGGSGYYKETTTRWIQLYSPAGALVLEMRGAENAAGQAYGALSGRQFMINGSWNAAAIDMKGSYYGLMFKGGAGAVLGGEGAVAALIKTDQAACGCSVGAVSGRAGVMAGGSAGFAFVMATGFDTTSTFDGFSSDGLDWALSFGPKWSGIIKGAGHLTSVLKGAEAMLGALEGMAKVKRLETLVKGNTNELYSVAKSIQARALVDDEYQGVAAFDIPLMGAGAEIGIYYAWSKFKLLSSW